MISRHWQYELERHKSGKKPRLFVALIKTSWWRFIVQGILVTLEVRNARFVGCPYKVNSGTVSISGLLKSYWVTS